MLSFSQGSDFVQIEVDRVEVISHARGDAELTIKVASRGFTGETAVWVRADSLAAFRDALTQLEKERIGRAVLQSMAPRELELVVRSVDSRGHMLVEGSTGRLLYTVDSADIFIWHAVHFGFEFDPSQLERAAQEVRSLTDNSGQNAADAVR